MMRSSLTSIPHASTLSCSASCTGSSTPCRAANRVSASLLPAEQCRVRRPLSSLPRRPCAPASCPGYAMTAPPAPPTPRLPPWIRLPLLLHRHPTASRSSSPSAWSRTRTALLPQTGRRSTRRPLLAWPRPKRRPPAPRKPVTPPSPTRKGKGNGHAPPPPYTPPLPWILLQVGRLHLQEVRLTFTQPCCSRRLPPSSTFTPRPLPSTTSGASSTSSSTSTPTTSTDGAISFCWSSANSPFKHTSSPPRPPRRTGIGRTASSSPGFSTPSPTTSPKSSPPRAPLPGTPGLPLNPSSWAIGRHGRSSSRRSFATSYKVISPSPSTAAV
jgi:hypothetical protein